MSGQARKTPQLQQQQHQWPAATSVGAASRAVAAAATAQQWSAESPPNFACRLRGPDEVSEGERLVLECDVSGSPLPAVNWYRDDSPLVVGKGVAISYVNGRCQLAIGSVTTAMSGVYMCRASNAHGKAVDSCRVTVRSAAAAAGNSGAAVQRAETRSTPANGGFPRPGSSEIMDANLGTKSTSNDRAAAVESPAAGRAQAFGRHLLKKADGPPASPCTPGKLTEKSGPAASVSSAPPPRAGTQDVKRAQPVTTPPLQAAWAAAMPAKGSPTMSSTSALHSPAAARIRSTSSSSHRSSAASAASSTESSASSSFAARSAEHDGQPAAATAEQSFQSSIQIQTRSPRQGGSSDPRDRSGTVNGSATSLHVQPGEEVQLFVSMPAAEAPANKRQMQMQRQLTQQPNAEAHGSRSAAAGMLLLQSRAKAQSVEDLRRAFSKDGGDFGPSALTLRLPPRLPSAAVQAAPVAEGVYMARLAAGKEGYDAVQTTSRSEVVAVPARNADVDPSRALVAGSTATLPARREQRSGSGARATASAGSGSLLAVDAGGAARPRSTTGLSAAETSPSSVKLAGGDGLLQAAARSSSVAELHRHHAASASMPAPGQRQQQLSRSAVMAADGRAGQQPSKQLRDGAAAARPSLAARDSAGRAMADADSRDGVTTNGRLHLDAAQRQQRMLSTDSASASESSSSASPSSSSSFFLLVGAQSKSTSSMHIDCMDAAVAAAPGRSRADGDVLTALPQHKRPHGVPVSSAAAAAAGLKTTVSPPPEQAFACEPTSSRNQRRSASLLRSASSEASLVGARVMKPGSNVSSVAAAASEGVKSLVNRFAVEADASAGEATASQDEPSELGHVAGAASLSSLSSGEPIVTKVTVGAVGSSNSSTALLPRVAADRQRSSNSPRHFAAATTLDRGKPSKSSGSQSAGGSSPVAAGLSASLGTKRQSAASLVSPDATVSSPVLSSAVPTGSPAAAAASGRAAASKAPLSAVAASSADTRGQELGGGGPRGQAGHRAAAAAPAAVGKVAAISSKLAQHKDASASAAVSAMAVAQPPPDLRSQATPGPPSVVVVGKAALSSTSASRRTDAHEPPPPPRSASKVAAAMPTSAGHVQHAAAVRAESDESSAAGANEPKAAAGVESSARADVTQQHQQLRRLGSAETSQRSSPSTAVSPTSTVLPPAAGTGTRPSAPVAASIVAAAAALPLDPPAGTVEKPEAPLPFKTQSLYEVEAEALHDGPRKADEWLQEADTSEPVATLAGATSQSLPNKIIGAANAVNSSAPKGGLSADDGLPPAAARAAPPPTGREADCGSLAAGSVAVVAAALSASTSLLNEDSLAISQQQQQLASRQDASMAELGAPSTVVADAGKKPVEKPLNGSSSSGGGDRRAGTAAAAAAPAAATAAPAPTPATEVDAWWIKKKSGKMPDPGHPAVDIAAGGSRRQMQAEPAQAAGAKAGFPAPLSAAEAPSPEQPTSAEARSSSPAVDDARRTAKSEPPSKTADGSKQQQQQLLLPKAPPTVQAASDVGGSQDAAAVVRAKSAAADPQRVSAGVAIVGGQSLKLGRMHGSSTAQISSSSAAVGQTEPASPVVESAEVSSPTAGSSATEIGPPAKASATAAVAQSDTQRLPTATAAEPGPRLPAAALDKAAVAAAAAETAPADPAVATTSGWAAGESAGSVGSSGAALEAAPAGAAAATKVQPADGSVPRFVIRPRTQYVKKGQTATLRCLADGQPKPTVTWQYAGTVLEPSTKHKMYVKNDFACLDVIAVDAPDHGEYSCTISNLLGSLSASVELDVSGTGHTLPPAASFSVALGSSPLPVEVTANASSQAGQQIGSTEASGAAAAATQNVVSGGQPPLAAGSEQPPCPIDSGSGAVLREPQHDDASCRVDISRRKDALYESHSRPAVAAVDPLRLADGAAAQQPKPTPQQLAARGNLGSRLLNLSKHYSTDVAADDAMFAPKSPAQQQQQQSRHAAAASELPEAGDSSSGSSSSTGRGNGGSGSSNSGDSNSGSGRGKPSPRQQALNKKLDLLGADALAFAAELDARTHASAEGAAALTFVGPSPGRLAAGADRRSDGSAVAPPPPPIEGKRPAPDGCEGDGKICPSDAAVADVTAVTNGEAAAAAAAASGASGDAAHQMPFSPPRFTKPLENQVLTEGDSVTIECVKSPVKSPGSSVSTVTAHQQADFVHEHDCDEQQSLDLSADGSSLDVTWVPAEGEEACPPDAPPTFVRTLVNCSVVEGQAVELIAEVFGTEPIDIVWVHNDEELSSDNPDYRLLREGRLCRLLITDVFVEDAGTYICEAYNKFGDSDTACSLAVRAKGGAEPPSFICPLSATLSVLEGSTVSLCCRISNVDPLDVTWSKNGRMARQGQRFKVSSENDSFSYEIQHVLTTDTGTYEVNAANDYGTVSCQCAVSVNSATPTEETDVKELLRRTRLERASLMSTSRPKFLEVLQDAEVSEGKSLALVCRIDGSPAPDVQWYIDGREVKASPNVSLTYENKCAQLLIKEAIASEHQGRYMCVATNKEGQEKATGSVTVKKTKNACTAPNPPVGKPFVTDVTSQGMTVAWYGPDYDGGSQVLCYKVEMCKLSLLKISQDKFWKTLTDQCKHTSYRVTNVVADAEYVFRIRAINAMGEGLPSDWSESAIATDRRLSSLSDSESQFETESVYSEYSEYSEYPESEYDYDLDEAFSDHHAEIRKDVTFDDQYDIKNLLGKGKFGSVYLCTEKSTGREWAAKRIKCRPSQKGEVMNEINIMNDLRHPKLVRLWEVFEGGKEMVLVTEYVGGGELFERIAGDDFDLTETDCVRFTKQICDGVQYMHEKCILHLDLKPENIICTKRESNQIKLIDFGLARRYKAGEAMKVMFGTPEFVAPEVINFEPIDCSADMWSIGVITYVLLSGLSPFCGDSDSETLSNVTKAQWEFDEDAFVDISLCAKDFISQLLVKRKESRMSAADCSRHLWLADSKLQRTRKLRKSKEKMKKFVARRKWQKTGMAIRALSRIRASLQSPSSRSPSPSHDFASPPPTAAAAAAAAAPSPSGVTRELLGTGSSTNKEAAAVTQEKQAPDGRNGGEVCAGAEGTTRHGASRSSSKPGSRSEAEPQGTGLHGRQFKSDDSGYDGTNLVAYVPPPAVPPGGGMGDVADGGEAPAESERPLHRSESDEDLVEPVFVKALVDASVVEGMPVCMSCEVRARPAPEVVWFKDGQELPPGGGANCRQLSDGCKHSLVIDRASVTDDAEYECRASNEAGEASSFAELYVTTAADAGS